MKRYRPVAGLLCGFAIGLSVSIVAAFEQPSLDTPAEVKQLIAVIAQVGPQGAGAREARLARDALAQRGVEILPALVMAMDTRNAVAANGYRTVWEAIVYIFYDILSVGWR